MPPMLGTVGAGAARGFGETVQTKPPVAGYLAWYDTTSVVGTNWYDKSGNGYTATIAGATLTATSGNGATGLTTALYGSSAATTQSVTWPVGILPATYTLFHVTRYTGTTNARIYTGADANWLSGHWSNLSGQYYHSGWITNNLTSYYANNWFITTDLNTIVRTNGIARTGGAGAGAPSYARLAINTSNWSGELSTWMTVECIVYNTNLSAGNYALVESYLANKYGITLNT